MKIKIELDTNKPLTSTEKRLFSILMEKKESQSVRPINLEKIEKIKGILKTKSFSPIVKTRTPSKNHIIWTPKEKKFLRRLIRENPNMPGTSITRLIMFEHKDLYFFSQRTFKGILIQVNIIRKQMGVKRKLWKQTKPKKHKKTHKPWTDGETKVLKENISIKEMSRLLPQRTYDAIRTRLNLMKTYGPPVKTPTGNGSTPTGNGWTSIGGNGPVGFPQFSMTKESKLLADAILQCVKEKKNITSQDVTWISGIDDWGKFVSEFFVASGMVAKSLGLSGKFVIERRGRGKSIAYRGK